MHTGTLINDLMAAVERAEANAPRDPQPHEQRRTRFYSWDAISRENHMVGQITLAGVA
jgi:hypothetical protein